MWARAVNETVHVPRGQRIAWRPAVRYRQGGTRSTVLLRNLTREGAVIEGATGLRVGDVAMIQLPTSPKAVWSRSISRRRRRFGDPVRTRAPPRTFLRPWSTTTLSPAPASSSEPFETEVEGSASANWKRALRVRR